MRPLKSSDMIEPATLEEALAEIYRLRHKVGQVSEKWGAAVLARELDKRAMKGSLRAERKAIIEILEEVSPDTEGIKCAVEWIKARGL